MTTLDLGGLQSSTDNTRQKKELKEWLSASDPSISFNFASKKRQPGTGLWFKQRGYFKEWQETPGSFFWLYGMGKLGCSIRLATTTDL